MEYRREQAIQRFHRRYFQGTHLKDQTQYLDLVFAHRFEGDTSMEEISRAFDWIIRHVLALYWGTSEWSAQQIIQAIERTILKMFMKDLNLHKPVVKQPQYNMIVRSRFEWEYENVLCGSTIIWSPLYQGLLTGKQNDDIGADGRLRIQNLFMLKCFINNQHLILKVQNINIQLEKTQMHSVSKNDIKRINIFQKFIE